MAEGRWLGLVNAGHDTNRMGITPRRSRASGELYNSSTWLPPEEVPSALPHLSALTEMWQLIPIIIQGFSKALMFLMRRMYG